jgi:hypothetical protein
MRWAAVTTMRPLPSDVIRDEYLTFTHPTLGRVLAVVPTIPEDAPWRIREGIARRRISVVTGRCPCGAVGDYGDRSTGEVGVGEVLHDRTCPADTARLLKAIRRWAR